MAIDRKVSYEMQGKVKNYLGKQKMVKAPLHWQSGPKHPPTELAYITKKEKDLILKKDLHKSLKGGVNRGPSGIISLNGWGSIEGGKDVGMSGAATSAAETGSRNQKDIREVQASIGPKGLPPGVMPKEAQDYRSAAIAAGAGQNVNPGWFGPRNRVSKEELRAAKAFAPQAFRASRRGTGFGGFGGNLLRGIMSIFGGLPGKAMSLLSRINPNRLRGKNPDGSWRTQDEWQEDKDARINQSNIDSILNRKRPITELTQKRLEDLGYTGEMPSIGSTGALRAGNELGLLTDRTTPAHYNDLGNEFALSTPVNQTVNNAGVVSDYPDYRTSNLGGTDQYNNMGAVPNKYNVTKNINQNWPLQMADGGRAGYQGGELVTDESMMEATPAGMMQENVEEVQEEPSRELLEALAMEIFQLPLEELNEEQLMIVYQAAMQQEPMQEDIQEEGVQFADRGQPMEEDIQEEDVQFAAQGGLAGLL